MRITSWLAAAVVPALLTTSLVTTSLALTTSFAFAQDEQAKSFLAEAIEGNLAEVQMGQLAQKLASTTAVRAFGQMLEQDHTVANQKARAAANAMQIKPPIQPNSKQKADYDRLSQLIGTEFDEQFADHMVMDHKEDIQKYEKAAAMNNPAGTYAKEALPTLRKHEQNAQSLKSATTGAAR
jgi:putative membrane protein